MLAIALVFLSIGIAGYALVETAWQGFLVAAIVGIGNGAFWPSQSSMLAGLAPREKRPAVFAMQRVTMNLGIGIGGLAGGFIAAESFQALFVLDALTFVGYAAVLWAFVPEPREAVERAGRSGRYRDVFRHRVFMGLMAVNATLIAAGIAQLEVLPAYAKNEVGIDETGIGKLFFINTIAVVLLQLPIARLAQGHRRMTFLALVGVGCAASWLLVPVSGLWLSGAAAFAMLAFAVALFGVAECLHGAVQPPLVADLADHRLIGRYMAISRARGGWASRSAHPRALLYSRSRPRVSGSRPQPYACWPAEVRSCSSAACPRTSAGHPASRQRPSHPSPSSTLRCPATRIAAMPVLEDPLSTDAQPASHPADSARLRHAVRTARSLNATRSSSPRAG
jgi:MFS family permease